jgi:hypothetical protein
MCPKLRRILQLHERDCSSTLRPFDWGETVWVVDVAHVPEKYITMKQYSGRIINVRCTVGEYEGPIIYMEGGF